MPQEAATDTNTGTHRTAKWPGEWPQSRQEFEAFVDVFLDRLVWHAFHRLGSREEAEDVVQDVMVKAYADRAKLRGVQRVGPYLYRMVANACVERSRRRERKVLSLDEVGIEWVAGEPAEVEKQFAAAEELQRIEQLLRRLPARQAEVIRLRILDQLPLADIAEIVGCSLATAKSRLSYGLQKLRRIVPNLKEGSL